MNSVQLGNKLCSKKMLTLDFNAEADGGAGTKQWRKIITHHPQELEPDQHETGDGARRWSEAENDFCLRNPTKDGAVALTLNFIRLRCWVGCRGPGAVRLCRAVIDKLDSGHFYTLRIRAEAILLLVLHGFYENDARIGMTSFIKIYSV